MSLGEGIILLTQPPTRVLVAVEEASHFVPSIGVRKGNVQP